MKTRPKDDPQYLASYLPFPNERAQILFNEHFVLPEEEPGFNDFSRAHETHFLDLALPDFAYKQVKGSLQSLVDIDEDLMGAAFVSIHNLTGHVSLANMGELSEIAPPKNLNDIAPHFPKIDDDIAKQYEVFLTRPRQAPEILLTLKDDLFTCNPLLYWELERNCNKLKNPAHYSRILTTSTAFLYLVASQMQRNSFKPR